jgi:hypothetical protein
MSELSLVFFAEKNVPPDDANRSLILSGVRPHLGQTGGVFMAAVTTAAATDRCRQLSMSAQEFQEKSDEKRRICHQPRIRGITSWRVSASRFRLSAFAP